ncbi:hypothetical protein [Hyphomonas chukchiensis]|uniref:Uncharacterized protein n=1 Tax=Hyphomonas chukchiensis TaxID=1280947 RepID=A0A062UJE6_9PROT|nr:hypothetical protein [Hyphomonas chukchiensis]KCZ56664.1 hypothetical protein HY30_05995 [Hyphomonas chukchiensis]
MPIPADTAKAIDTRVNTARSLISAASLLIAGLSFFAFQYLGDEQPKLRTLAMIVLGLLLVSVLQCVRVTSLASNIYAKGCSDDDKRYPRIGRMITMSSAIVLVSMLIFIVIAGLSIFETGQAASDASESLHYQCDIDYGEEGNRTATMSCIRTEVKPRN